MKHLSIISLAAAFAAAIAPRSRKAVRRERSALLGALTPAHKALLASVVGQLATVHPQMRMRSPNSLR